MATTDAKTAVGVFEDRRRAEVAVAELGRAGFGAEEIGFILPPGEEGEEHAFTLGHSMAAEGAEVGAVVGGLVGIAVTSVLLPGAGIVVAGGLLAGILEGLAAGAASGGIFGSLIGLSIPEEEARRCEKEFHSGSTLVTVITDGRYDEAVAILKQAEESPEPAPPHRGMSELAGEDNSPLYGNPQP